MFADRPRGRRKRWAWLAINPLYRVCLASHNCCVWALPFPSWLQLRVTLMLIAGIIEGNGNQTITADCRAPGASPDPEGSFSFLLLYELGVAFINLWRGLGRDRWGRYTCFTAISLWVR